MSDTPRTDVAIKAAPAIKALKESLAQTKKMPTLIDTVLKHEQQIQELKQLVTPMMEFKRREWVGLTDDEIWEWFRDNTALTSESGKYIYQAIEAKLREKNT